MTCENSNVDITLVVYLSGSSPPPRSCLQRCLRQANTLQQSLLAFCQTFFLTPLQVKYLLTFFLTSFRTSPLTFCLTFFPASPLTFFPASLGTFCLTFFLGLLTFFLASLLTFFLPVGPAANTGTNDRGWGPAAKTGRRWSRLRFTSEHWMQTLAGTRTREEKQKEKEEKEAMTSHRSKQPSPDRWNCYC